MRIGLPFGLLAACVVGSIGFESTGAVPPMEPPEPIEGEGYSLVWHDEFDGSALNEDKWSIWTLGPRRDAINTAEAVSLDGEGHLAISVTQREGENGEPIYETGGIWTRDTYVTKYGYFEARMKVQDTVGFWSAFWMNSPRMGQDLGDPAKGGVEIDIMEAIAGGEYRDRVMNTIHWDGYGEAHKSAHSKTKIENLHTDWHTFAVKWTPDELVFYTDGAETWRTDAAVPQLAEYLLLTCEVGDWGGEIADADLPSEVLVDFVRVWQKDEEAGD